MKDFIMLIDGNEVNVSKDEHRGFFGFDTQEGEPVEHYYMKYFTLETAIDEYLSDLAEAKSENA